MERKIVYAYVCADIIHTGHILALENAKTFGHLIVGVLTDEAIMEKKAKPVLAFSERLNIVRALKCVDVAVTQADYSPIKNIESIKPDVLMESDSHTDEDLAETYKVAKKLGIKVIKLPYYPLQSSSKIKNNIYER